MIYVKKWYFIAYWENVEAREGLSIKQREVINGWEYKTLNAKFVN
jgi:hypothetical protein